MFNWYEKTQKLGRQENVRYMATFLAEIWVRPGLKENDIVDTKILDFVSIAAQNGINIHLQDIPKKG